MSANTPRTPLKELNFQGSDAFTGSAVKAHNNSFLEKSMSLPSMNSAQPLPNIELMQARIAHLEKDRVELSLHLHRRDEKDRDRKIKMDQMENNVKAIQKENHSLVAKLRAKQEDLDAVLIEKTQLQEEIENFRKEQSTATKYETQEIWNKITATSRELKKSEDEKRQLITDNETYALEKAKLRDQVIELEARIADHVDSITSLNWKVESLDAAEMRCMSLEHERMTLKTRLEKLTAERDNESLMHREEIDLATSNYEALELKFNTLQNELERKTRELEQAQVQSRSAVVDMALDASNPHFDKAMQGKITQMQATIDELEKQLIDAEKKRRKLHNKLQDLRGNVRVFVRCRPFLPSDGTEAAVAAQITAEAAHALQQQQQQQQQITSFLLPDGTPRDFNAESTAQQTVQSCVRCLKDGVGISLVSQVSQLTSAAQQQNMQQYCFDRVFAQESTQEDVYGEVGELVQSAMDGYRVCLFSYGQTGSGKTHTMTGSALSGEDRGIIPRAFEEILSKSRSMQQQGAGKGGSAAGCWKMSASVSIVELYNEEIRDLLVNYDPATASDGADGSHTVASSGLGSSQSQQQKMQKSSSSGNGSSSSALTAAQAQTQRGSIRIQRANSRVHVSGLASVGLDIMDTEIGKEQFKSVFAAASQVRATASTGMNATSSRSHLVVMIDIAGRHSDGVTTLHGGLRLCDLAGSERLDRTGTLHDAARLRETVNINKSLSCLADVFLALSNKAPHVPYRNSKLTMLLQDCLSGDGKALMIVNVSPTVASTNETACSLRFANQVSQVELGKATKQVFTSTPGSSSSSNNGGGLGRQSSASTSASSGVASTDEIAEQQQQQEQSVQTAAPLNNYPLRSSSTTRARRGSVMPTTGSSSNSNSSRSNSRRRGSVLFAQDNASSSSSSTSISSISAANEEAGDTSVSGGIAAQGAGWYHGGAVAAAHLASSARPSYMMAGSFSSERRSSSTGHLPPASRRDSMVLPPSGSRLAPPSSAAASSGAANSAGKLAREDTATEEASEAVGNTTSGKYKRTTLRSASAATTAARVMRSASVPPASAAAKKRIASTNEWTRDRDREGDSAGSGIAAALSTSSGSSGSSVSASSAGMRQYQLPKRARAGAAAAPGGPGAGETAGGVRVNAAAPGTGPGGVGGFDVLSVTASSASGVGSASALEAAGTGAANRYSWRRR